LLIQSLHGHARLSVSCRGNLIIVHGGILINIGDIDKRGRKKNLESRKRQRNQILILFHPPKTFYILNKLQLTKE